LAKVVFDSSFLMAVAETPTSWQEDMVSILGKVEPVMLRCVLTELDSIDAGGGKRARLAAVAKAMAAGFRLEECGRAAVDDEVVSFARTHGAGVATVDGDMLRSLKAAGLQVLTLRGKRVTLA
jgi:rRNA-processing protein FCF1